MEGVCAYCVDALILFMHRPLLGYRECGIMLFKKKTCPPLAAFDRETCKPVLKCSICNGEQVAGFKNVQTGKFEEIMLIRNETDLRIFKERYGISEITKEY